MPASALLSLLAVFALAAVDLQAEPWIPVDCADRAAEVAALREERGLGDLAAERAPSRGSSEGNAAGDSLLVPHPFPETTEQVLVDLEHALCRLAERSSMLEIDRALVRDLASGRLHGEVQRVENWSSLRCLSHRRAGHYFLVRLREPDGRERARAALKDSGVLASWVVYEADAPELASPEQAKELLAALGQSGLPVRDAQYVVVDGLHRRCLAAAPHRLPLGRGGLPARPRAGSLPGGRWQPPQRAGARRHPAPAGTAPGRGRSGPGLDLRRFRAPSRPPGRRAAVSPGA